MKNRKAVIAIVVLAVLVVILWDRLGDFGAEIYTALA